MQLQGHIGNCWIIAAIAAVAHQVQERFVTRKYVAGKGSKLAGSSLYAVGLRVGASAPGLHVHASIALPGSMDTCPTFILTTTQLDQGLSSSSCGRGFADMNFKSMWDP